MEESVGQERRGQSTEDGGEGKDTEEDGMDEAGGGCESAHVKEEQEGEVVMAEKEGGEGEELQAGEEENAPEEKQHQSESPFISSKLQRTKRKGTLTGLRVVVAIS